MGKYDARGMNGRRVGLASTQHAEERVSGIHTQPPERKQSVLVTWAQSQRRAGKGESLAKTIQPLKYRGFEEVRCRGPDLEMIQWSQRLSTVEQNGVVSTRRACGLRRLSYLTSMDGARNGWASSSTPGGIGPRVGSTCGDLIPAPPRGRLQNRTKSKSIFEQKFLFSGVSLSSGGGVAMSRCALTRSIPPY